MNNYEQLICNHHQYTGGHRWKPSSFLYTSFLLLGGGTQAKAHNMYRNVLEPPKTFVVDIVTCSALTHMDL